MPVLKVASEAKWMSIRPFKLEYWGINIRGIKSV